MKRIHLGHHAVRYGLTPATFLLVGWLVFFAVVWGLAWLFRAASPWFGV